MKSLSAILYNRFSNIIEGGYDAYGDNRDGLARSRRGVMFGNLFATLVNGTTAGLFMTGLLLNIMQGQSDAYKNKYIGLFAIFSTGAGIIQLFSPLVMERIKRRKPLLMVVRGMNHFLNIVALGIIPFVRASMETRLGLFVAVILLMYVSSAFCGPGFSIWHMSNVPKEKRANFFSIYNMVMPTVTTLITLCASFFIDKFADGQEKLVGILILRIIAIAFACVEMLFFATIKEPEYQRTSDRPKLASIFTLPLRSPKFMKSVLLVCVWTFSANIMGQYYMAYLLDTVKVSYTVYSLMGLTSIPILIVFTPLWTQFVRKHSWISSLMIAAGLYSLAYLMNLFVTAQSVYFYIVIVVYCNLLAPAINLIYAQMPYMNMPPHDQTNYFSFYATMSSLSALLGSTAGRLFIGATEGRHIKLFGLVMQNRQYMNILSFSGGIVLVCILACMYRKDKAERAAGSGGE